jgi:hypothetical protein
MGTESTSVSLVQQEWRNRSNGVVMRDVKLNGTVEQRQRISDELRQLKLMSKGLRTRSLRAHIERHATERTAAKRTAAKTPSSAAAA